MGWSGGTYTRGYASWTADANAGLPISASKFDTEDNDFAAGLNNCLTKDGLSVPGVAMTWAKPLTIQTAVATALQCGTSQAGGTAFAAGCQNAGLAAQFSSGRINGAGADVEIVRNGGQSNVAFAGANVYLHDSANSQFSVLQQSGGQTELHVRDVSLGANKQVWRIGAVTRTTDYPNAVAGHPTLNFLNGASAAGDAPMSFDSNYSATGSSTASFSASNKPGSTSGNAPARWKYEMHNGVTYVIPMWLP
jgi:hypothetical protein